MSEISVAKKLLVLGGTRSGKSCFAETWCESRSAEVLYIATSPRGIDAEMDARIARHEAQRPAHWRVQETELELAALLREQPPGQMVLVDCLTLWLGNVVYHRAEQLNAHVDALVEAVVASRASLCLVSSEVGLGVVPESASGRAFRDQQGWLNQRVAAVCDAAALIVAGMALPLQRPEPGLNRARAK